MDAADFTPSKAAEMMTYETQFLISKENRPEVFHHGLMNVATQFHVLSTTIHKSLG